MARRPIRTRPRIPDEGPSEADVERFSDVTDTCPECGTQLYDDVAICWKCGYALGSSRGVRRLWPAVLAVLLIVVFLFFAIRP